MSRASSQVHALAAVRKNSLDSRSYRAIKLDNDLAVLLIQDELSEKAAAAMDVGVGSSSDPEQYPGLAHFLEHMLFMGTKQYPEEESFKTFITESSGYTNAYTDFENTNFHFQIAVKEADKKTNTQLQQPSNHTFFDALRRFSQFFIAPLFAEGATTREVQAVESEHQLYIQRDGPRQYQLLKALANHMHPFHKFSTGSKSTLGVEKHQTMETRKELLKFYAMYYSANIMNLCVVSPYPLDTVQEWIVRLFSEIENKKIAPPWEKYKTTVLFEKSRAMGSMCYSIPIMDVRILTLYWPMAPMKKAYTSKSDDYVAHLLHHEGPGSLISLLRRRKWANNIWASTQNYQTFSIFVVQVDLTQDGTDHVQDIICLIFGIVHLIQRHGIQRWIFDEVAALCDMGFRFRERGEPYNTAEALSSQMSIYQPIDWVSGSYLMTDFDTDGIKDLLNLLTPDRMTVMVVGKFVEDLRTDKTEKWYGTPYRVARMTADEMATFASAQPDPELRIPSKNKFIPKDFSLIATPLAVHENDLAGPVLLLENRHLELYFKLDRTFQRPKAAVRVQLYSRVVGSCARNEVLANMFTQLFEDSIQEECFDTVYADLSYYVIPTRFGMQLGFSGYNEKLGDLAKMVLERLSSFEPSEGRFEVIRDQLDRSWANFDKSQPYTQALYNISQAIEEPSWHVSECLRELRNSALSVRNIKEFKTQLLNEFYSAILVHGNVTGDWAKEFSRNLTSILRYECAGPDAIQLLRVCQVPKDHAILIRERSSNPEDRNSAATLVFQVGCPADDLRECILLELLSAMMDASFFHELRDKQQLGYFLFENAESRCDVLELTATVQSATVGPDELWRRMEDFMFQFRRETLENVNEEEFSNYVESAIALRKQREERMSHRTARFWSEITSRTFMYDRAQIEMKQLVRAQKKDVLTLFDRCIDSNGPDCRKVISLIYGCDHSLPDKSRVPAGTKLLKDPWACRLSLPLHPIYTRRKAFVDDPREPNSTTAS